MTRENQKVTTAHTKQPKKNSKPKPKETIIS
jgi:hypothetical protein